MAENEEKLPTPEERLDRVKRIKWISISGAIALGLLGIVSFWNKWVAEWDKLFPQRFDALVYVNFRPRNTSGLPLYYWVDDTNEIDHSFCPVGYILNVSITNLQSHPATLLYYEVSIRRPNGDWVKLPHIPWQTNRHLYAASEPAGLSDAVQFVLSPSPLDEQLSPTSRLEPFSPLVGSSLFEDPFPSEEEEDALRVKVSDTQGHKFTSRPIHLQGAQTVVGGLNLIAVPGKRMDLTKRTMEPHCPGVDN